MKTLLTPIPTEFKGITYRSRTEARWAVFFDALGAEFTYEPEGYQLGDVRYLSGRAAGLERALTAASNFTWQPTRK